MPFLLYSSGTLVNWPTVGRPVSVVGYVSFSSDRGGPRMSEARADPDSLQLNAKGQYSVDVTITDASGRVLASETVWVKPPGRMTAWTQRHLDWIRVEMTFEQFAQQATREDCLAEVDHLGQRIVWLEKAIDEAIEGAPATMKAVVNALQALRGVAKMSAITTVVDCLFGPRSGRPLSPKKREEKEGGKRQASYSLVTSYQEPALPIPGEPTL